METVTIALGSNLGKREENIRRALHLLQERVRLTAVSPFVTSEPAEGARGGRFLNGACRGETRLAPAELHAFLRRVERRLGRPPRRARGSARVIDLDIVFFGNRALRRRGLEIPHPRFSRRLFVLEPLAEIAPAAVDPRSGKTVAALLRELRHGTDTDR